MQAKKGQVNLLNFFINYCSNKLQYFQCVTGSPSVSFWDCTNKDTWRIEHFISTQCHNRHSLCQPCQLRHCQVSLILIHYSLKKKYIYFSFIKKQKNLAPDFDIILSLVIGSKIIRFLDIWKLCLNNQLWPLFK